MSKLDAPSEQVHLPYQHAAHRSDVELSKSQQLPRVSPHHPASKNSTGSGEGAIFRPFEKDGPSQASNVVMRNDKTQDLLSVPPLRISSLIAESEKVKDSVLNSGGNDDTDATAQQPATVRVFGSTPEVKIINSNFINHRVEKFDFKSLARECVSSSSETSKTVPGADETAGLLVTSVSHQISLLPSSLSPVLVSRLDKKEERLRTARANGTYNSESEGETDSEAEEDKKRERLTIFKRALPDELEVSPSKVMLLHALGLSTLQKKKGWQDSSLPVPVPYSPATF